MKYRIIKDHIQPPIYIGQQGMGGEWVTIPGTCTFDEHETLQKVRMHSYGLIPNCMEGEFTVVKEGEF